MWSYEVGHMQSYVLLQAFMCTLGRTMNTVTFLRKLRLMHESKRKVWTVQAVFLQCQLEAQGFFFLSFQQRFLSSTEVWRHYFHLTIHSLRLKSETLLPQLLLSLSFPLSFLKISFALCVFSDTLAPSKGTVKTSNFIKYRRRRGTAETWKNERRMYGGSMGGIEKRLETAGKGKRYELSEVKDNKVWEVFPLFDVLPSGSQWQRPLQSHT